MIKSKITTLIILISIVIMGGCSSLKVTSDYDKTVDFTKFKTFEYYGWAEESDQLLNRFDKERIEKAFGAEFKSRGMEYVESGGDLIVTLYIVAEQKTSTTAHTTSTGMGMGGAYGYGYGGYYGHGPSYGWGSGMGMGHSTTTYSESDYVVGTLIIDVYDEANKQLIWESVGKGNVNENPDRRDESVPKTVAKIMKPYPVEPIKEK